MTAKELRITGKVHDVGYRLFLLSEAEGLSLERFVAWNIITEGKDCVLVRVDGPDELVSQFVAFAESQYPPTAVVDSVEVRSYADTVMSIDAFRQSFMVTQLAKIAQTGVSMLGKQDAMLGKQDETIAVIKDEGEKTRAVVQEESEKTRAIVKEEGKLTRDLMSAEGEKTREVVKEEGEKTRGVLKGTVEEEIAWVKDELIDMKATLNRVKQKVGVE
jgi:acylphosphatase